MQLPTQIKSLSLSDMVIDSYTGTVDAFPGRTVFEANTLPEYLFLRSPLLKITLPKSLTTIPQGLCAHSDAVEITVQGTATSAGDYAFYGCDNLISLKITAPLASIGRMGIANCPSLESLDLSSTRLTALPDQLLSGCQALASLKLPAGISSLGTEVFSSTALTELSLPTLKEAAPYALAGIQHLTTLTLNNEMEASKGMLMDDTKLESVSNSPACIPVLYAANDYRLNTSSILPGTTSIGDYAFYNNRASHMILGPDVTYVGRQAMGTPGALTGITATDLKERVPDADPGAFEGFDCPAIKLYVAKDSRSLWTAHPVWGKFDVTSDTSTIITTVDSSYISVSLSGGMLYVNADNPIASCRVYDTAGQLAASGSDPDGHLVISLPASQPQPWIVAVECRDGSSRTVKLLGK